MRLGARGIAVDPKLFIPDPGLQKVSHLTLEGTGVSYDK
jgi:hypothetical protein